MSYYNYFSDFDFDQPYFLSSEEKSKIFLNLMNELTAHHRKNSQFYAKIIDSFHNPLVADCHESVPFLPVRLFKNLDLLSVPRDEVFKTLTSSGTSGHSVSKIFLNRDNASMQTRVLGSIVSNYVGKQRSPMLIVDAEDILTDRAKFSARAAGVLGFSMYGRGHAYALDSSMILKLDVIDEFCNKFRDSGIYSFGFTFVVWKFLYQYLEKINAKLDFGSKSILIHGGGWKKLVDESVSNDIFKGRLLERTGLQHIHSYYGLVEQTGSIYMECEHGNLHSSNYSDVIIRDPITFTPCKVGEQGLVQVLSVLPFSYPGHSLLTEDVGVLRGEDDCPCGRMGKYFHVHGRMKSAEVRGCSDVRQF